MTTEEKIDKLLDIVNRTEANQAAAARGRATKPQGDLL